jgi:hypothetical protein
LHVGVAKTGARAVGEDEAAEFRVDARHLCRIRPLTN